jgi:prepilin-type N-terminal cleavage/methylation domain-containing protein
MHRNEVHPNSSKRNAFTLLELLVVLTLIGIICALALPSLTHTHGVVKLDAAAEAIHASAQLARHYAISYNQPTYLVLREGQSSIDKAYRTFSVFTIDTHTQPVTQNSGTFIQDWEALPAGIVFDRTMGGTSNLFFTSTRDTWNGALSKNNQLLIQYSSYVVLGYQPNGKSGSASHWIYLVEGFYDGKKLIRQSNLGKLVKFSTSGQSQIINFTYSKNGDPEGVLN